MKIKNVRLSDETFHALRKEILASWPTGAEVDLDEAIEYQKEKMSDRNVMHRLKKGKEEGDLLTQPRAGISPLDACIDLMQYLQNYGLADILPTSVDSYTRANRYESCEEALQKSEKEGRSYLNGLPVVNYGVKNCRKLIESLKVPMELRTAAVDVRITAEIALAAGYTAFIHGAICPTMHYSKNHRLATAMDYYQYVFRLIDEYTRRGVPIVADVFGLFSNVGVPQSLIFAAEVIEALTAAAQGVKYIALNVIMQGNLVQDIASTQVLPEIVQEYLKKLGFNDIEVFTVANQWTGPYPPDEQGAYALDAVNTVAAVNGNADMMMVKSIDQGFHLPAKEANGAALRFNKYMINYLKQQRVDIGGEELQIEKQMIIREVRELVDKMLEMGDGDPIVGCVNAFESGVMESPFSSNIHYSRGQVMVSRDSKGMCRYLEVGQLPFSKEVIKYHQDKLKERIGKEHRQEGDISLIVDSILSLSKGCLV